MTDERRGAMILGAILIVAGGAFLVTNVTGFALDAAWPLFVIVPGLVLLVVGLAAPVREGSGLAVAGAITTTTGLVLAFQNATDSWATKLSSSCRFTATKPIGRSWLLTATHRPLSSSAS